MGDRRDVGGLLIHAAVKRRREMLGPDAVKGRQAKRGLPVLEKRVVCHPAYIIDDRADRT
jgi:hypothetical protein